MKSRRFHKEVGPRSLFERVDSKMAGKRQLTPTRHARKRMDERGAPETILEFDSDEWELMTAEANVNSGRFMNCAYRREIQGEIWWIVIGFGDKVETVYDAEEGAVKLGRDIVEPNDDLYRFVESINAELLA